MSTTGIAFRSWFHSWSFSKCWLRCATVTHLSISVAGRQRARRIEADAKYGCEILGRCSRKTSQCHQQQSGERTLNWRWRWRRTGKREQSESGAADGAASFKTSFDCLGWLWVSTSVRCYGKLLTVFWTHIHTHWVAHTWMENGWNWTWLLGLEVVCVICHHTNRQVRQPKTLICSAIAPK